MLEIRSWPAPSAPAPIEAEPPPTERPASRGAEKAPLDEAVTLDLSPEAKRIIADGAPAEAAQSQVRYRRDVDAQQMVFQVIDPSSGSVLDQLPSEAALRAKTYARETQAAQTTPVGTTVAREA
ncbi:flagellar protein FlaG [Methylobacterium sp. ID0610]|uniref:flagellar protein FlaG n=1 Tax=Methylobacterium carpenticola TaxID=3344827 RepID=UPI003683C017